MTNSVPAVIYAQAGTTAVDLPLRQECSLLERTALGVAFTALA